jgi:hypothetical protein
LGGNFGGVGECGRRQQLFSNDFDFSALKWILLYVKMPIMELKPHCSKIKQGKENVSSKQRINHSTSTSDCP